MHTVQLLVAAGRGTVSVRGSRGQVLYKSSAGTHAAGLKMMGCTIVLHTRSMVNAVGSRDMIRSWTVVGEIQDLETRPHVVQHHDWPDDLGRYCSFRGPGAKACELVLRAVVLVRHPFLWHVHSSAVATRCPDPLFRRSFATCFRSLRWSLVHPSYHVRWTWHSRVL